MSRGQYSLFNSIFGETKKDEDKESLTRNMYMPLRNEHLVIRYYYYVKIEDLRYEKCLEKLQKEFYLSERRIVDVLSECDEQLKALVSKKPTLKEIQKQIPHFSW